MHSCFDPCIIYGFNEGNREFILDRDFMNSHDLTVGALDIVKGYCGEACYGVPVNIENGQLVLYPKDKERVDEFFKRFMKLNNSDSNSWSYPTLGFHSIITGDYQICAEIYTLDIEEKTDLKTK